MFIVKLYISKVKIAVFKEFANTSHRGLYDNLAPKTIWHQRQFGTADNLAPQTIWHRTNCPHLACGAKLSAVPNCPLYTTVPNFPGAKLSTFSLQCQLVHQHGRCQIVQCAKLSAVPNCPRTPQSVHLLEGGGHYLAKLRLNT